MLHVTAPVPRRPSVPRSAGGTTPRGLRASGVGLAVSGAGLVALARATARPPDEPVPDRDGYLTRWSRLHGGYDAVRSPLVRTWLGVAYRVGRPLAARGVLPDVVTLGGVWVSAAAVLPAAARGRWPVLAAVVTVGSGLADNLDGCVAALTGKATAFGYVLDSLVDRGCDALYLLALRASGAPAGLCVAAGSAVATLEYTRARAGNAGMGEIAVVTVGERPTRVIVTTAALLCAGLYPGYAAVAAGCGAAATAGLSTVGWVQLLLAVHRRLAGRPADGGSPSGG